MKNNIKNNKIKLERNNNKKNINVNTSKKMLAMELQKKIKKEEPLVMVL
jgi:ABC-type proline/glycine betaine transport system substrate-binding protein